MDDLVGRHRIMQTSSQRLPLVVAESLAQLLPTVVQTLLRPRTDFNQDHMTVLVRPDPDTLVMIMAVVALRVEHDRRKEPVLEGHCFWSQHVPDDDVHDDISSSLLLDVGRFFNGLLAYCKHAGTSPLTWILTALVSRDGQGLLEEDALWRTALSLQKEQALAAATAEQQQQQDPSRQRVEHFLPCPLLQAPPHPTAPVQIHADAVVHWMSVAMRNGDSHIEEEEEETSNANPYETLFFTTATATAPSSHEADTTAMLLLDPVNAVKRMYHAVMERLSHAVVPRRPLPDPVKFILDTEGTVTGYAAAHRIETGEELSSFFMTPPPDKRLFVNLLFSLNRSRPPVCWTSQ